MSTSNSQLRQHLRAQIADTNAKVAGLQAKLRALDELLESVSNQQQQYQLLEEICASLDKLSELGAASLFWEAQAASHTPEQKLRQIRAAVAEFHQKISTLQQSRSALQSSIQEQLNAISHFNERLAQAEAGEWNVKSEYIVERKARPILGRPLVMPWAKQGEEERRYRKILSISLLGAALLSGLVLLWKLPPRDRQKEVIVPERLARLVKKMQEKQVESRLPEKKEEKPPEQKEEPVQAETTEAQQARARAETKGVLAHKSKLADLMKDSSPVILGAGTRVSNSGRSASGEAPRRSIIVAQSSGGIGGSKSNRPSVRSNTQSIAPAPVQIARIESAIDTGTKGTDRLINRAAGPTRSDEEIQIVFDRYKSALYRIYNRELRNDPTLRGKIVLRITIEPDGHVSECSIKSSDLESSILSDEIVGRVLKFNFGPKPGVKAITILYPIDFLPAT